MLFGLVLLLLAEVICHLGGWGLPELTDDPYVGFESVVPLFVESEDGRSLEIAPGRLRFFAPDSFTRPKSDDGVFRIFCLGGSTVQGRPFSIETSFATALEQALRAAAPETQWEVVNCGGVSYASYRLVPIFDECLKYEPDLMIVCTGHNEFLEDRTYGELRQSSSTHRMLGRSRLFTLLRSAMRRGEIKTEKHVMAGDVEARLDYKDGLELYQRDDAWHTAIASHFQSNLMRMAESGRRAGVPTWFMLPPSNLADSPPFKSEPDPAVADELQALLQEATQSYRTDLPAAIEQLKAATELDQRNAAVWYELGRACESSGRMAEARRCFIRARDEDVCPLRMTSSLEQAMREVASQQAIPLLDTHKFLEDEYGRMAGDGMLVDHIHPSFVANRMIATELVRRMIGARFLDPVEDWEDKATTAQQEHFESLDSIYFLRGQRTLESLREWARGRGINLPDRK